MPQAYVAFTSAFAHVQAIFPSVVLPQFSTHYSFQTLLENAIKKLPVPKVSERSEAIGHMKSMSDAQQYHTQKTLLYLDQKVAQNADSHHHNFDDCLEYELPSTNMLGQKIFHLEEKEDEAIKIHEYIDELWWTERSHYQDQECYID